MTGRRGQAVGSVLAGLWLLGVLGADLATRGPGTVLSVFFGVAPLIACAVLAPAATTAYAVTAVALVIGSGSWDHTWGMTQHYVRIADVAVVSALAVAISVVRVRREKSHARLVLIAEAAQRAVLPRVPVRTGPLRTATRYLSAAEDALIGGDFYDVYHSENCVRMVIGDVRGKGLAGVEHAARVIRAFRQSAAGGEDLADVAAEMNDYLQPFFDDEEFATAYLVHLSTARKLTLVNCGHPAPMLLRTDGQWSLLDAPEAGLPLGLGRSYTTYDVNWGPGDRLLLYTDGLVEARDRRGRFLPIESLTGCLRRPTLDESLDAVLTQVKEHVPNGRLIDDLALVLLENVGGRPGLTQIYPAA